MNPTFPWWYPVGAQGTAGGTAFRVWADEHRAVSVVVDGTTYELKEESNGYFSEVVAGVRHGQTYGFLVDGEGPFADPASRYQPEGPHGLSQIVDPARFSWSDHKWAGIELAHQVIYEMHVGTFTTEGTWRSAIAQLPALVDLGITVLELMPVADFSGKFGWGYDGVNLFAPTRNYGVPDDFRAFIDAAHATGLAVILDVVYNHLGPDGNYLTKFSNSYLTTAHQTDWGAAMNFDGEKSGHVREFYLANAAYWIKEFHLDGLRLDATQDIYDTSPSHIISEISQNARKAAETRRIILVGENEPQDTKLIRSETEGGYGLDALWNDDFHHSAMVAATGNREAYYTDYLGSPQELLSAMKHGFLYQGQWYSWQNKRRGHASLDTKPASTVAFIQNHDQIANSARGLRIHELTEYGKYKALTAICLLGPATPMLFQGQEFAASSPFLYFADHQPELAELVRKGREKFRSQWRSLALREVTYDDPAAKETFEKCKLRTGERDSHGEEVSLHRDLLKLRRQEPLFSRQDRQFDGAILGPDSFMVRFFSEGYRDDKILVVNLGTQLHLNPSPVPLLGPPDGRQWQVQWSTEDPRYGGNGTPPLDSELNWMIPGAAAVLLEAVEQERGTS